MLNLKKSFVCVLCATGFVLTPTLAPQAIAASPSEASVLSMGLTASMVVVAPYFISTYLSGLAAQGSAWRETRHMKIQKIVQLPNNKTVITAYMQYDNRSDTVDFEVDTQTVKNANLKPNDYLLVEKIGNNYAIKSSNQAHTLAIVQSDKGGNFKEQKLN